MYSVNFAAILGTSITEKVGMYADIYSDIMTWFSDGSRACGKANQLLKYFHLRSGTSTTPELAPSSHWWKACYLYAVALQFHFTATNRAKLVPARIAKARVKEPKCPAQRPDLNPTEHFEMRWIANCTSDLLIQHQCLPTNVHDEEFANPLSHALTSIRKSSQSGGYCSSTGRRNQKWKTFSQTRFGIYF